MPKIIINEVITKKQLLAMEISDLRNRKARLEKAIAEKIEEWAVEARKEEIKL